MNITEEDWKQNAADIPKELTFEHMREIQKHFKENAAIPFKYQALIIREAMENVIRKNSVDNKS